MMSLADRRKSLLASKYNQRSQFNFYKGHYGPTAQLLENLESSVRDSVTKDDPACDHHLHWPVQPQRVLVVKKFRDHEVTEKFKEMTTWLVKEKGLTVLVEPQIHEDKQIAEDESYQEVKGQLVTWKKDDEYSKSTFLETVEFIICIGGDGTLLYTSSMFKDSVPPIMSFHMGSLGFLTPFKWESFRSDICRVMEGQVSMTLRHRLECVVHTDGQVPVSLNGAEECPLSPTEVPEKPTVKSRFLQPKKKILSVDGLTTDKYLIMNEVVVDRGATPYLTNLQVFCNGRLMTTVQADGIIIATPTGSTAYSLAAGASMVHPSVPCMIVTPICPHSLSFRPIVIPAGVDVTIKVAPNSRNPASVAFDGKNVGTISQGDSVTVTTSASPVPSINNTGHVTDWFDSLAECLHWNVRKEQKML